MMKFVLAIALSCLTCGFAQEHTGVNETEVTSGDTKGNCPDDTQVNQNDETADCGCGKGKGKGDGK